MSFRLGARSEQNLQGVHADLVRIVRRAITLTPVDFAVHEGLRMLERQRLLVAQGASRTLNSYHLTGHAVDLVPWVAGRLQWQLPACIQIARAVKLAADAIDVPVTWGAVWDRDLSELDGSRLDVEVELYIDRFRTMRGSTRAQAFIDGCHFQVAR